MNKRLLLIPLALLLILAGIILALPAFVASQTHRANMEAFASALTGRHVTIHGALSLTLFPEPQLTAAAITLTGPAAETITARSLTLDISLPALLRGRLIARTLTLDSPTIAFPWPLPGGPKSIAPPAWLAALHAQITRGDISLGAAHFSNVNADLFTGADGAVSISGTGALFGQTLTLSLALGAAGPTGAAPFSANANAGPATLHFAGALDASSTLTGQLTLAGPTLSGTANLTAGSTSLNASALQLAAGKASISGTASLTFARPALTANLAVANLNLDTLPSLAPPIPISLTLAATNLIWRGQTIPAVLATLRADPAGITIPSLTATLPANATLTASGADLNGAIQAHLTLASPNFPGLLAPFSVTPPPAWTTAQLAATLAGPAQNLTISHLTATLGPDHLTGNFILTPENATGALGFDHLDLLPVLTALLRLPQNNFTAGGELTAANATLGGLQLKNFLADGAVGATLNLRRVSASLYGGLAAGAVTLAGGQVLSATGFLHLPSAAPLAPFLALKPPAALLAPRLDLAVTATQKSNWLLTTLTGTLGDFSFSAAPALNLAQNTAYGPVILHHPSAIAAFKLFNLPAALAWPGPGSISLRADFIASPTTQGLPDFVLSLGDLTASGRLLSQSGILTGDIAADTLALPALAPDWQPAWPALATAHGQIALTANRVLYAGGTILLDATAGLTLTPNHATLALVKATLAGGALTGAITATAGTPPALTAKFTATGVDAAQLQIPIAFPWRLTAGTLAATASLSATGYSPKTWPATLAGTASLGATNGALSGFTLAGLATALTSKTRSADLRAALATSATPFTRVTSTLNLASGNATLGATQLISPAGAATATGSLDVYDKTLAIHLSLTPKITPPITLETTLIGPFAHPKTYPKLKPALAWKPAPKT